MLKPAYLARDVAPDLDVIVLTHYPDADTLDTFRPGETTLEQTRAVNRAVAEEMLAAGVQVLVQRADRGTFRRYMSGREDTAENRRGWIDRERLLHGAAALELLGVKAPAARPAVFGAAPGPIADRLLAAYEADDDVEDAADSGAFDALVRALLAAGRTDVLDLAVRKLGERDGDEAGDELNWVFLVAAEGAPIGPSGWAELVALAVALPAGDVPDGEAIAQGLIGCGALPETDELRLLPGWRSPDALAGLSFGAVRRVLLDVLAGRAPQDLPPGDTDDLAHRGFGVLIGLRIDWDIPVWERIEAAGGLPDPVLEDAAEARAENARADLFNIWRGHVFDQHEGCVVIGLAAFSEVAGEIAEFMAEAGAQTEVLEEIRDFVAVCRRESGGEVKCVVGVAGDGVEVSVFTEAGRFLDSVTIAGERLPVAAGDMADVIGGFARVVEG